MPKKVVFLENQNFVASTEFSWWIYKYQKKNYFNISKSKFFEIFMANVVLGGNLLYRVWR